MADRVRGDDEKSYEELRAELCALRAANDQAEALLADRLRRFNVGGKR